MIPRKVEDTDIDLCRVRLYNKKKQARKPQVRSIDFPSTIIHHLAPQIHFNCLRLFPASLTLNAITLILFHHSPPLSWLLLTQFPLVSHASPRQKRHHVFPVSWLKITLSPANSISLQAVTWTSILCTGHHSSYTLSIHLWSLQTLPLTSIAVFSSSRYFRHGSLHSSPNAVPSRLIHIRTLNSYIIHLPHLTTAIFTSVIFPASPLSMHSYPTTL